MQRVVIDCRFANSQSGLGRYTRELTTALLSRNDGISYVLLLQSAKEDWAMKIRGHLSFDVVEAPIAHYSMAEQTALPGIIRRLKADLLFAPHFNVPLLCPIPFVCTIHDLILHRYPNQASGWTRFAYQRVVGHAVRKARALIAVSEFTASEIRAIYGEQIGYKAHVIRESASPIFCPRPEHEVAKLRKAYNLQRPFFLYLGNAKEHKNVQLLIDAYGKALDTPCDLILISNGPEVDRLQMVPHMRVLRKIDDTELPAFYTAAQAFVTASLYEGFCLPIVEAQACGCPVIATNMGAIPEIAGEHAILLPPDVDSFTQAFLHPLPRFPARLASGWQEAGEETAGVLRAVLDSLATHSRSALPRKA